MREPGVKCSRQQGQQVPTELSGCSRNSKEASATRMQCAVGRGRVLPDLAGRGEDLILCVMGSLGELEMVE